MEISDEKVLRLCKIYGERARFYRQKFLGLLPEIFRRRLYEKQGCTSVFEFAAKVAGVSEEQVSRVLNLERKFQDKPDLHKALVDGEISINKLRRIVVIATQENQKLLLEQIKILPQKAVETLVRDEKNVLADSLRSGVGRAPILEDQTDFLQPKLSDEVKRKLSELQNKGIDINELILDAVEKRDRHIAQEKEILADEQKNQKPSRHTPAKIERIVQKEYGTKCAVPICENIAEEIHHEIPFALLKNHNPYFLKPFCKEHHIIAHGVQLAYQRARSFS